MGFDQGEYLFNNQFHPEVIDKVYQQVLETTWSHCVGIQKPKAIHQVIDGHMSDFVKDEDLNLRMGFPKGSYTFFIKDRLLQGNQKYILEHFIRGKEMLTLRDMLQNDVFTMQYIFHMADYVFMNLKVRVVQNGSYLIIPTDTPDGVTSDMLEWMIRDYDNKYTSNRWCLEVRPKVSYVYGEGMISDVVTDSSRIYLDQFTELKRYYRHDEMNEWKVCMSDSVANPNLLRMSTGILQFDEEDNGRPYLEITQLYYEYIAQAEFPLRCFAFNEGMKAGYTISPNYIGPTVYLKTVFDEYLATITANRLKVIAMNVDGGWTAFGAFDKHFGFTEDLAVVGFDTSGWCWVAVPTEDGIDPIGPRNFRVWEYDHENDTMGRLVCQEMNVTFPNIYHYYMVSECKFLYIEWFREDELKGSNYDDFTKPYRDFLGGDFYVKMNDKSIIKALRDFKPQTFTYDSSDMITKVLLKGSCDYRRIKIAELLNETSRHWIDFVDAIDDENAIYRTVVIRLKDNPEMYEALKNAEDGRAKVYINASSNRLCEYDLYIDGVHIGLGDTSTFWDVFRQYVVFPSSFINEESVIIIDFYEYAEQICEKIFLQQHVDVEGSSLINYDFPMKKVSGRDLVLTDTEGNRLFTDQITYGLHVDRTDIQVPETMIDWKALGVSPKDLELVDRIGEDPIVAKPPFRALTFRFIAPPGDPYLYLKTVFGEALRTIDGQYLKVKSGNMVFYHDALFCKRVNAADLFIKVGNLKKDQDILIYTANVKRSASSKHLDEISVLGFVNFCGSEDFSRIVCFINGRLAKYGEYEGSVPAAVHRDYQIKIKASSMTHNDRADAIYLPFAAERVEVQSDEHGFIHLENAEIDIIGHRDMIFQDGYRIPNDDLQRYSNMLIRAPMPNTTYTIIRQAKDPFIYDYKKEKYQSIDDKILADSPNYRNFLDVWM